MSKSPVVILYDASGVAMAVADSAVIPVGTRALLVAGSDGTDTHFVRIASDGTLRVDPSGTTSQPIDIIKIGGIATSLGQKPSATSVPVVAAPDQLALLVVTEFVKQIGTELERIRILLEIIADEKVGDEDIES